MLVSERIITKFSFFLWFHFMGRNKSVPRFWGFCGATQEKEKLTKEISELEVGGRDVKVGLALPPEV